MSAPGPQLPECRTLALRLEGGVLRLTLDRPQVRNAMSLRMVEELRLVFQAIRGHRSVRAVVLRGAGGHFCAGADLKDLAAAGADRARWVEYSRAVGRMMAEAEAAPQVVIALLEGAVLGGGFGLACAADVALAEAGASLGMPETTRGIPPAQIAPFVVRRIGLSQARRLALLGLRLDAAEAARLGVVHQVVQGAEALEAAAAEALSSLRQCAPGANAATKALLLAAADEPPEALVERAAHAFADALTGPEGREGTQAFVERRPPGWAKP
jgi:isohexenylglutaconyl-CoA hydratase